MDAKAEGCRGPRAANGSCCFCAPAQRVRGKTGPELAVPVARLLPPMSSEIYMADIYTTRIYIAQRGCRRRYRQQPR